MFSKHPRNGLETSRPSKLDFFDTRIIDPRSQNRCFPNIPEMVWRSPDRQKWKFLKEPTQKNLESEPPCREASCDEAKQRGARRGQNSHINASSPSLPVGRRAATRRSNEEHDAITFRTITLSQSPFRFVDISAERYNVLLIIIRTFPTPEGWLLACSIAS